MQCKADLYVGRNNSLLRMNKEMDPVLIERSETFHLVDMLAYKPHTTRIKSIIRKITGQVNISAVAAGEITHESTLPFDCFIQIIDGAAILTIDGKVHQMQTGQGLIIPAHTSHYMRAEEQFKMITTLIKSGYEV
jgi:quercetin dioxygenase-like cupin family protein